MNIIISSDRFVGLAQALTYCGHNVLFWDRNGSVFDLFYKTSPDLFIIEKEHISEPVGRCLLKNPQTRLVVYGGTFNRCDLAIDNNIDTSLFFSPAACNVIPYTNVKHNPIFECDLAYIGKNNKTIQSICCNGLNVKAFGENIGNRYYCGTIRQELIGDLFHTADNVLHIHENESSQQLFEIMYCEGQVVSDPTKTTQQLLGDRIACSSDAKELHGWLKWSKETSALEDNRRFVFDEHTYFDRAASLFKELNLPHNEIKDGKEQFKNEYF